MTGASSQAAIELVNKHKKVVNNLSTPIPIGLHFNLTEGEFLSQPGKQMLNKSSFWNTAQQGAIDEQEIKNELIAQIQWFIQHVGYEPAHIDGHNHIHVSSRCYRWYMLE